MASAAKSSLTCQHALVHNAGSADEHCVARHYHPIRWNGDDIAGHELRWHGLFNICGQDHERRLWIHTVSVASHKAKQLLAVCHDQRWKHAFIPSAHRNTNHAVGCHHVVQHDVLLKGEEKQLLKGTRTQLRWKRVTESRAVSGMTHLFNGVQWGSDRNDGH